MSESQISQMYTMNMFGNKYIGIDQPNISFFSWKIKDIDNWVQKLTPEIFQYNYAIHI